MTTNNPAGDDGLMPCLALDKALKTPGTWDEIWSMLDASEKQAIFAAAEKWQRHVNTRTSPAGVDNHEEGGHDCKVCEDHGVVATNRNCLDGWPIEAACPACNAPENQPKPSAPSDAGRANALEELHEATETHFGNGIDQTKRIRKILKGLSAPAEGWE